MQHKPQPQKHFTTLKNTTADGNSLCPVSLCVQREVLLNYLFQIYFQFSAAAVRKQGQPEVIASAINSQA